MVVGAVTDPITVTGTEALRGLARKSLGRCGVEIRAGAGPVVTARTPITGESLFDIPGAGVSEVDAAVARADAAFARWRTIPAPRRGAVVKRLGQLLAG